MCTGSNTVPVDYEKSKDKNGNCKSVDKIPWEEENNYINYGEEDQMEVYGYASSFSRKLLVWALIVLTCGILRLVFHWWPEWMLYATHRRCPLRKAEKLLILSSYEGQYVSHFVKDITTISIHDMSPANTKAVNDPISGLDVQTLAQLQNGLRNRKLRVFLHDGSRRDAENFKVVWIKKCCYVWCDEKESFVRLTGLDCGVTHKEFHSFRGLEPQEQFLRRHVYGRNTINVPVQRISVLVLLEILNPFYCFQIFTVCVWLAELYLYYTVAVVLMSAFGVVSAVYQTRQNQKSLHETVHVVDKISILRADQTVEEVPTTHLVPGDVIIIPAHGLTLHCDAVLLNGQCIVNESMLTGESTPVLKTALPKQNILYNETEDTNHTLFCGTIVLQGRNNLAQPIYAVVLRTGFLTTKGSLVRSILYPPPADFKFDKDTYKFIWILTVIAAIGLIYTIVSKVSRGVENNSILLKALDIVTIVIPPALPAAMTVGKIYALNRLKKANISCINSRVINVTGSIDCICFDKTGTLTEDGLDMWGVVPVSGGEIRPPVREVHKMEMSSLKLGMATCQSLTLIDGVVSGDPLDLKMFESTDWTLEEPSVIHDPDVQIASMVVTPPSSNLNAGLFVEIVHQFQFSSTLQRMSVITKVQGAQDYVVFCKGSPEMIESLSKPETIPKNINSILKEYTEQGYRVIAMGTRVLKNTNHFGLQSLKRNQVEQELEFLGLIILENRLKPQTVDIIQELKKANIKVIMITGDNVATAASVAKECGIVNPGEPIVHANIIHSTNNKTLPEICFSAAEISIPLSKKSNDRSWCDVESFEVTKGYKFAITGPVWEAVRTHYPELIPRILVNGAVFARMSSAQKQQVVLELQHLDYHVAMCGDGANDCGALRAAHAGISLSEAESSIASPFTAREPNISCVPRIIKEGRAALTTSFGVFKFMILYSLAEFWATILLYSIDSNLTDFEFLFIDMALVVNFACFFGRNKAYNGPLSKSVPQNSLLAVVPICSMLSQIVVAMLFQCISFNLVHKFSWFAPFVYEDSSTFVSYENYAVFTISMFQYIIFVIVFSKGKPYRTPLYKNKYLSLSLFIMTLVCMYIVLVPTNWVVSLLELKMPPKLDFPLVVIGLAVLNLCISLFVELFLIEYVLQKKMKGWCRKIERSCKVYEKVRAELRKDSRWPSLSKQSSLLTSSASVDSLSAIPSKGFVNEAFINEKSNETKL